MIEDNQQRGFRLETPSEVREWTHGWVWTKREMDKAEKASHKFDAFFACADEENNENN